ncbi:hypothetical protein ACHAXT_004032 [Thalassiosira profunda]
MGNCLQPESAAAAAETIVKPSTAAIDGGAPCDEQVTVDSSFATVSSPPSSPAGKSANNVATSRRQGGIANKQSDLSHQNCSGDASVVEQHREEGQRRLRELVVTGANDGSFDWASIIALAEDLHRKEQLLLRSSGEGRRNNASRRQAFFEKRRRAKERARRRKLESVGSFSVNLLAYEPEGQSPRRDEGIGVEKESNAGDDNDAASNVSIESGDDEALNESRENDEMDVFEDDDDDPPALSPRISLERPGTPLPLVTPTPIFVNDGSFLAATSLFGSVEEEEEESSSEEEEVDDDVSSAASIGKAVPMMTIDEEDENATLGEF